MYDVNCQFSPPHRALALHDKVQHVTWRNKYHPRSAPPDRPHYCFISQPRTKVRPVRRPFPNPTSWLPTPRIIRLMQSESGRNMEVAAQSFGTPKAQPTKFCRHTATTL